MEYEFIRERKTQAFPNSMYQVLLQQRIDAEHTIEKTAYSYSYVRNPSLVSAPTIVTVDWAVPEDYFYHLEGIRAAWPFLTGAVLDQSPPLSFKLYQLSRNREWSVDRIDLRLDTTPAAQFGTGNQGRRYMVRQNVTFAPNSVFRLEITGHNGTDPTVVHLMTEGLRIPRGVYTNQ